MNDDGHPDGAEEEGIRVFVRIRPLNKREIADKQTIGWDFNSTSLLEDTQNGQRVYAFDRCYNPDENNKEVYELVGKPVILKAMEGYNGTVFTYGQTGSGKTFTMRGCDDDPGMMILCINDIFDFIDMKKGKAKYTLKIAYMEVYNEEINDLLGEGPGSKNLRIVSEDSIKGAVIGNLTEVVVEDPLQMLEVLRKGESSRSYGSTTMNAESSRSHTIYRISIESVEIDQDPDPTEAKWGNKSAIVGVTRLSFMNLVDLAGSERQKSTNASGKTLKEGANINKSLLALGAVINKLGEASKKVKGGKPVFLPYRDSKLTRILKQSLGGNTMTSILCTITPAPMHREETVSTLKFGQLCKTIKNTVKSNEVIDDRMLIKQYKATIQELRVQVNKLEDEAADKSSAVDHAIVTTLQQDKKELESKVKSLEVLVMRGTNALEEINTVSSSELDEVNETLRGVQATNINLQNELNASKKKVRQLNAEIINLEHTQASLEADLGALNDFEDLKNTFEDYQQEVQAQIDDDRTKMEAEKETLQNERSLTMAERTHLDEQEGKLGLLLAALDERESKLRHHLNTLKEQEGHWQQSIEDLTRREELVEEWQSNHRGREKKLQDWDDQLEKKFSELSQREAALIESEHSFKTQKRELGEREQRLQVALSRVAHTEQAVSSLEEKLSVQENVLKVRESEMDVKEREIVVRRRELEQWDSLIREKDRKVVVEQRHLEEREDVIRVQEEKVRIKEDELEKGLSDIRQKEADVKILKEKYTSLLHELETRESMCAEQTKIANNLSGTLSIKEGQLQAKESRLNDLEIKLKDTDAKTEDLNRRVVEHDKAVDKFFNQDVALITARHAKEMNDLEELIQQQLVSVSNFQAELDKIKEKNSVLNQEKVDLENELNAKVTVIHEMEEEMVHLEEEREALKQEAEEERRAANKIMKESGRGSPRPNGNGDQVNENGVAVSDAHGVDGKYSNIANRSFLVQLAETQAMLKAVLEAQTKTPSKSYIGNSATMSNNGLDLSNSPQSTASNSKSKPRSERQQNHSSGNSVATNGAEYPQPSREDIQNLISSASQSLMKAQPNDIATSGVSNGTHPVRGVPFPSGEPEHPPSSFREAKSEASPEQQRHHQQHQENHHQQNPQQHQHRTPTSGVSENAMRKLTQRGSGSPQSQHTPPSSRHGGAITQKPKFEVIPNTAAGYSNSRGPTAITPARGGIYTTTSSSTSDVGTGVNYGSTPVVSVELSLNRSGNSRTRGSGVKSSPRR